MYDGVGWDRQHYPVLGGYISDNVQPLTKICLLVYFSRKGSSAVIAGTV